MGKTAIYSAAAEHPFRRSMSRCSIVGPPPSILIYFVSNIWGSVQLVDSENAVYNKSQSP